MGEKFIEQAIARHTNRHIEFIIELRWENIQEEVVHIYKELCKTSQLCSLLIL